MKLKLLLTSVALIFSYSATNAQGYYTQYFDGADTSSWSSIFIKTDTAAGNVWQVGKPQKMIFDSASTLPNALVTDTINFYPANNISRFQVKFATVQWSPAGILALQWKQKIDLDAGQDGAIIEFSADDTTWQNAFNNPYVYNFYGYNTANADTLASGEYAFSGTDSTWRDIWLCFDLSWMWTISDSITVRFTLKSDSVNNNREGWMIDNMIAHVTGIHTVKKSEHEEYLKVFPTATTGIVHIETAKLQEYHIIESIEVMNAEGKIVDRYGISPTKFYIDLSRHRNSIYYIRVKTNFKTETFKVILQR